MLYIEDFLELIEPFPQELRERLTEMREIDLKIQNETDKIDSRIDTFFQQCKKQKADWKSENCEEIKKEYLKLLENADDKIQIANQLHDLIEKYLKKLDQELQKFKLELEADHAGITSKLEQVISSKTNLNEFNSNNLNLSTLNPYSSLNYINNQEESDFILSNTSSSTTNDLMLMMMNTPSYDTLNTPSSSSHKRKHSNLSDKNLIPPDEDSSSSWNSSNLNSFNLNRKTSINLNPIKRGLISNRNSLENNLLNLINNSVSNLNNHKRTSSNLSLKTKRIRSDKTRTVLKKNRINELDFDDETYEDDDNTRNEFYQSDDQKSETGDETNEAASSEVTTSDNGNLNQLNPQDDDDLFTSDDDQLSNDFNENKFKISKNTRGINGTRQFKDEWNSGEDTNERYCICKDVSYGDMIMCDNTRCDTQWFHFTCVGLASAPKGKWFCPTCAEIKKKRRERHLNAILSANSNLTANLGTQPSSSSSTTNDLINQLVTSSNN